jgi:hypothetical protein
LDAVVGEEPEGRLPGLRNLVVFGRAVTNVLQNLRATEEGDFDEWYKPFVDEMRADPLMRFFYKLRSEILKKGRTRTAVHGVIQQMNLPQDLQRFGPPPPGATSFFIGDSIGGTGWEVELPDGTPEKYYVALPEDIGKFGVYFPDAPPTHLEEKLDTQDIGEVCRRYSDYLERLVKSASDRFS